MSWYLTTHAGGYFVVLHNMLTGRPEVPEVHCVKDAKVGISIDLPYAQLKVMSVPENVDETSWRSLSGVHANKCILQLIPNMKVSACISSGSQFIALSMGMSYLLGLFYYRSFNHCCDALSYGRKGEEFMVMLWLTAWYLDIVFKLHIWILLCYLFSSALQDLLRPDFDWGCPFGPFPCAKKYTRFLKICLSASKQDELGEWVGWVKLRFRSLLVKVGGSLPL
ncbi:hypothetical protein RHMOL_Rhmol05G0174500 [Rhododendron molle]|uniref:Uncharacterized protein n=1 Tax=Rhododendron molle TaxID=49168 RepID=A0ACC0NSD0_RHOML|nr:hypothetical protein RHMOL_Rhmol05G0174500 [Rhododendron molle]